MCHVAVVHYKVRWQDSSQALWILANLTTRFIKSPYFSKIISNGTDLSIYSENFCLDPRQKS